MFVIHAVRSAMTWLGSNGWQRTVDDATPFGSVSAFVTWLDEDSLDRGRGEKVGKNSLALLGFACDYEFVQVAPKTVCRIEGTVA